MDEDTGAWRVRTLSAKNGAQKLNSRAENRRIKMFVIFFLKLLNSFGFLLFILFVLFPHLERGRKPLSFVHASVS